jgi:hypothetical protein
MLNKFNSRNSTSNNSTKNTSAKMGYLHLHNTLAACGLKEHKAEKGHVWDSDVGDLIYMYL